MSPSPLKGPADWLDPAGGDADVVVTSRVRLARNFAGFSFVNRAARTERAEIVATARERLSEAFAGHHEMAFIDLNDVTQLDRSVLHERHLISSQHARGDDPRAVAVSSPDETLSIMVNEEDHLRMQVLLGGLALRDAFERANDADDLIEAHADYAYSPRFGYLTACPTNVGTGIRVSLMLHLPALKLTGELEKVKRAASGMSLAIRGYYGEGSDAVGDFFQISNQTTLGKSEREVLAEFESNIIPRILEYERAARRTLIDKQRMFIEDETFRALGVLRNARLLKTNEAMELLSKVRLGVVAGLITDTDDKTITALTLQVQPAHLQRCAGKQLDQGQRRVERATMVRQALNENASN